MLKSFDVGGARRGEERRKRKRRHIAVDSCNGRTSSKVTVGAVSCVKDRASGSNVNIREEDNQRAVSSPNRKASIS